MHDIERARRVARLAEIAYEVEPELDEMTQATLKHMFLTIQKHDLTSDAAIQYCFELYSHYKLKQRFSPRRVAVDAITNRSESNGT